MVAGSRFPGRSIQVPVQFTVVADLEREHISVTEASGRGVARLVADAAHGAEVVVTRRGAPVAAVVSVERLAALDELRRDLFQRRLLNAATRFRTGVSG